MYLFKKHWRPSKVCTIYPHHWHSVSLTRVKLQAGRKSSGYACIMATSPKEEKLLKRMEITGNWPWMISFSTGISHLELLYLEIVHAILPSCWSICQTLEMLLEKIFGGFQMTSLSIYLWTTRGDMVLMTPRQNMKECWRKNTMSLFCGRFQTVQNSMYFI